MNRRETAFVLRFQHALWSADGPKSVKGRATCINLRGILNCIALHADFQTGYNSYVSAKTIQQRTGIKDLDTIYRAIAVAEEQGWLTRQKGNPYDARGYTYQVHIPENCTGKQYPKISGINNPIQENQGIHIPRNSDTTRAYNQNLLEQTKTEGGCSSRSEEKEQTPPPAFEVEEKPSQEEPPPISDADLGLKAERPHSKQQPSDEQPGGDNHLLAEFKHLTRRKPQSGMANKARAILLALNEHYSAGFNDMDVELKIPMVLQNQKLMDAASNDGLMDELIVIGARVYTNAKRYSRGGQQSAIEKMIDFIVEDYGKAPPQHKVTPEVKKPHAPELNGGVSTVADLLRRSGK